MIEITFILAALAFIAALGAAYTAGKISALREATKRLENLSKKIADERKNGDNT